MYLHTYVGLCMYYINMYIHVCVYHLFVCMSSICLSVFVYVYIYIYIFIRVYRDDCRMQVSPLKQGTRSASRQPFKGASAEAP